VLPPGLDPVVWRPSGSWRPVRYDQPDGHWDIDRAAHLRRLSLRVEIRIFDPDGRLTATSPNRSAKRLRGQEKDEAAARSASTKARLGIGSPIRTAFGGLLRTTVAGSRPADENERGFSVSRFDAGGR
jgi:hypothetical protein